MFIPVPIKAKYFVPGLVLVDLYLGVLDNLFCGGGIAHFAHVEVLYLASNYVVLEEESV
jgi:hypothetical protein